MADRRLKQPLALFVRIATTSEAMEDVGVQGPAKSPTQTALTLWMAGSSQDVGRWIQLGSILPTGYAAPCKSSYVGLRHTADHAAEYHKQRCSKEGKPFDKKEMRLFVICLDFEAYVRMSTDKIN